MLSDGHTSRLTNLDDVITKHKMMDHLPSTPQSIQAHPYMDERMMVDIRSSSDDSSAGNRGGNLFTFRPVRKQHSNSLPNTLDKTNRSESIPISTSMRRIASEARVDQVEAEADYQDYLFFTRVVSGISSKQSQYQDGHIKYENELTLKNIVRTRHEESYMHNFKLQDASRKLASLHDANYMERLPALSASLYSPFTASDPAEEDAFDFGVFDMEL
jgi:hypothetical protein